MSTPAMTYDSLIVDIQTYAERSDTPFVDQIPRLIMLAENRIASEIHALGFLRIVDGTFTILSNLVTKPSRWRETRSLFIPSTGTHLLPRSLEYCQLFNFESGASTPRYYADYDYEHFFVAARPLTASAFRLSYYERPEPLSLSNQTNWTTQYAPQLLLYATLLEAQPFLKLPERIQEFQMLFDRAAATISGEDNNRKDDKSSSVSKK